MLSNINYFGLLILFLFLTGCDSCEDRGQITVVEGRVTDAATGNPAVGASVALWIGTEDADNFNGGPLQFSTEKITDSTGFYSLTFFNGRSNRHSMQVLANEHFSCSQLQVVEIGERNEIDFAVTSQDTLLELAFVQTDFENNPDSVAVSIHFETACVVSRFELNNYVLSTNLGGENTLQIFSQPNVQVRLDFIYFENGVTIKSEDISVPIGASLEILEIEY